MLARWQAVRPAPGGRARAGRVAIGLAADRRRWMPPDRVGARVSAMRGALPQPDRPKPMKNPLHNQERGRFLRSWRATPFPADLPPETGHPEGWSCKPGIAFR